MAQLLCLPICNPTFHQSIYTIWDSPAIAMSADQLCSLKWSPNKLTQPIRVCTVRINNTYLFVITRLFTLFFSKSCLNICVCETLLRHCFFFVLQSCLSGFYFSSFACWALSRLCPLDDHDAFKLTIYKYCRLHLSCSLFIKFDLHWNSSVCKPDLKLIKLMQLSLLSTALLVKLLHIYALGSFEGVDVGISFQHLVRTSPQKVIFLDSQKICIFSWSLNENKAHAVRW